MYIIDFEGKLKYRLLSQKLNFEKDNLNISPAFSKFNYLCYVSSANE